MAKKKAVVSNRQLDILRQLESGCRIYHRIHPTNEAFIKGTLETVDPDDLNALIENRFVSANSIRNDRIRYVITDRGRENIT